MSDTDPRPPSSAKGFSTRAIRAASRIPAVEQTPTSVPIYQTATFASADADELGQVAADGRAGFAYSRISNPTTSALGSAYAELAGGAAGAALASGMGAIHATLASLVRAGDRIVAPIASYGSTRSQLNRVFGGFGVRVDIVDTTDLDAVAARPRGGPDQCPVRRDHRQPDDPPGRSRGARRAGPSPRRDVRRRQHVRVALRLPPARLRRGPRRRIGDQVPGRPQRRHRRRGRRLVRADRGRRARADRHRGDARSARGVPGPARDPDPRRPGRAPRRDGGSAGRLARGARRRALGPLPGPRQPPAT